MKRLLLAFALVSSTAHGQSFQGLGSFAGGSFFFSLARGVSDDGSVVAGYGRSANGDEGFLWTQAGGIQGIGDLPGGSFMSLGQALSADGLVVVGESMTANGLEAFRWTQAGGMQGIGTLGGPPLESQGKAVSADGSVIVGQSISGDGFQVAYRWTQTGGMQALGTLGGGIPYSDATAVSADGSVVVGQSASAEGFVAFRWQDGGMTSLGVLPGGTQSIAYGTSADGSVVVGRNEFDSGHEAFRWTAAGGLQGLGDLPGGEDRSVALAVSADGSTVVGYGQSAEVDTEAFIWTEADGMRSLKAVLEEAGLDLTGWTLIYASAVSADGTVIVGAGSNPQGLSEGWRASLAPSVTLRPIVTPDQLAVPNTQSGMAYQIQGVPSARLALVLNRRPPPPPALPDSMIVLTEGLPASPNGFFQWTVPDDVVTTFARLALIDTTGTEPRIGYSARFRIRPLALARVRADSTYQFFDALHHGFAFGNRQDQLFPPEWFGLPVFDYSGGQDPFRPGEGYPFWMNLLPVFGEADDFPDWPSFARVFGPETIYTDDGLPLREAIRWSNRVSDTWQGSCYGMSQTALMVFSDPARFAATFPEVGLIEDDLFLSVPTLTTRPAARIAINRTHTWQQGSEALINDGNRRLRQPGLTAFDLQQMFESDDLSTYRALSLFEHDGTPGSGGHTVLPIEIRPLAQPGRFNVFIYDPNLPGEQNQLIEIDANANRWVYNEPSIDADDGRWEGSNQLYVEPPVAGVFANATRPADDLGDAPARAGGSLTITATPGATVALTNPQGQTVGFAANTLTEEIPGAVPIIPKVGGASVPVGFAVPPDAYRLSIADAPGGRVRAMTDPSGGDLYGFQRVGSLPGETDRMAFDDGFRAINPDAAPREVTLFALRTGPTDERLLATEALGLSPTDSVGVQIVADAALSVRSFADATTYRLHLLHRDGATTTEFVARDIVLAPGATHTAVPTWTDLSTVRLDIDIDSDGTVDDTITLANAVASAPAPGPSLGLALSIAPNPTAGSVRLGYAVDAPGAVRLAVYDALGREVAVPVDAPRPTGWHETTLDVSALAPGVYVVRLAAPNGVTARRLTVAR